MTSHERHGVSNHHQLDRWFHSLFKLITKMTSKLRIDLLWGEPGVHRWIPLTKGYYWGKRFHVMTSSWIKECRPRPAALRKLFIPCCQEKLVKTAAHLWLFRNPCWSRSVHQFLRWRPVVVSAMVWSSVAPATSIACSFVVMDSRPSDGGHRHSEQVPWEEARQLATDRETTWGGEAMRYCVNMLALCAEKPTRKASLKTQSWHDANFVVTGDTTGCHYDNLWCHQRRQSWHYDNFVFTCSSHWLRLEWVRSNTLLNRRRRINTLHIYVRETVLPASLNAVGKMKCMPLFCNALWDSMNICFTINNKS